MKDNYNKEIEEKTITKGLFFITTLAWIVFGFIIQWYLIENTTNDFIGNWLTCIYGLLLCLIIHSKKIGAKE